MARKILTSTRNAQLGNLHYYNLPKGLLTLKAYKMQSGGKTTYSIDVDKEIQLVPDPEHRYFFRYHANPYTSDNLEIAFTPQGFLKSIKTTVEDETGDIIEAIVDLGKAAVTGLPPMKTRGTEAAPVQIYEVSFDPFDAIDLARVNKELADMETGYSLSISALGGKPLPDPVELPAEQDRFGIFCRPVETFELVARMGEIERRQLVSLPHPRVIHFVEIPMAPFVTNEFEMQFDEQGYPLSLRVVKPSPALAIIQVPLNIIKSLLELPAQIFKFRIDTMGNKSEILKTENALRKQIESETKERIQDKMEMEKLKKQLAELEKKR